MRAEKQRRRREGTEEKKVKNNRNLKVKELILKTAKLGYYSH